MTDALFFAAALTLDSVVLDLAADREIRR